jgi:transposase
LRYRAKYDQTVFVLKIETITDLDTARNVALMLQKENERIHARLDELVRENAKLKGQDGNRQLELEIHKLQSQMSKLQKMMFGSTSERRGRNSDEVSDADRKDTQPQTGHGPREQRELDSIDNVYELPEEEKVCDACGGMLDEWEGQADESEEISVVQRMFFIKKNIQKKYRCKCGGCIKTASKPPSLINGGRYTPEFAVEVATEKYLDHMPLERQVRKMKREGLNVDSQTLWDQLWYLSQILKPAYMALLPFIFSFPVICADESIWYYLQKGGRKRWYIWGASCPFGVHYRIDPSRSGKVAKELLGEYAGKIITDGYEAYNILIREGPDGKKPLIILVSCWAHTRRGFTDCEKDWPEECGEILDMMGELYAVEREVPNPWLLPESEREDAFKLRAKLRHEKSRPITTRIKSWAMQQLALKESDFRKAVEYMLGHWDKLMLFLDDPYIPLDTNEIERGFRGPVVGRKNHYGSKSLRGTEVAAIIYSLIESAKLCGINPHQYLLETTKRLLRDPEDILLPHQMMEF